MSFELLDEHEKSEVVRKWLRENAMSIVIGVGMALVMIFGWQQWKARDARQMVEAATHYQALSDAVAAKNDDDVTQLANALRADYPKSAYATMAALQQAELASAKGDLAAAVTSLEWARDHAGSVQMKALATLRLARTTLAQGNADAALKLLDGLPKGDFVALASDIRGDALNKLGRAADARAAYEETLSHLEAQTPDRAFVQMKLDDLAVAESKPAATAPAADTAKESAGS